MRRRPTKEMIEAWDKCANRNYGKNPKKAPLGLLAGGCPNCGHICSFESKEMHCYKCGWDWKDEKR